MLKIGCTSKNITPENNIDLAGFIAREQPMLGVHDPLFVNTMVLSTGEKECVIISCDLLSLSFPLIKIIRDRIYEKTGIPIESILIATTHTHSGPITSFMSIKNKSENILPNNSANYLRRKHLGKVEPIYINKLIDIIVLSVLESKLPENMEPISEIELYKDTIEGLSIDRRAMTGKKGVHGPLVTKESDIDNNISFLLFKNKNKNIKAILINYACHPVVKDYTNRYISSDFPGVVRCFLMEYFKNSKQASQDMQIFYLNGACGNINPIIMGGDWTELEQFGKTIATKIIDRTQSTPDKIYHENDFLLNYYIKTIQLPLRILSKNEIDSIHNRDIQELKLIENKQTTQYKILEACLEWWEDTIPKINSGIYSDKINMELQLIDLSIIKILALSGEIFSKIGKNIKNQLDSEIILVGYANGNSGYIPTAAALTEGGYETEQAYRLFSTFPLSPQAEEIVVKESLSLGQLANINIKTI